ncbi:MAG: DNA primase DnaG [Nitrososphaeraceae archaeon]|jgi:DNA primase|nr:DNA primase DnaG [Nitrososphaeraceae archaeon]MDW0168038.1 DNA primase DnaG [Nitrososphaeraceae archaeon]MDW0171557.1 DNA primase DnaG [Nitrososphaeraceae archaeon]MDW0173442.1 DNA primase DnaG [Nitrososphaeraceae archaeon]MDW0175472.1 DNA primase DnaG [Nitrososphaeraceae archaeon]
MPNTGIVKYHVKLKFEVDGIVEKADIIGAIFGQTEGLLGPEMNLNELQKVSKVGRIEVNVDTKSNTTKGDALLPMSTDISTAALISAAIESIDKVGPFQGKFLLVGIDDIRAIKKKVIVDRAKKIIQEWATKTISEGEEMLRDVYDASKPGKLTTFGKAQLACGTGVFESPYIILVEGRADVINLLRAGFDNSIAIEGAKIDETITNLTSGKKVIAFLDGDRAADLILKELQGLVKIDKVLRAPTGKEVEECTPLEISEILKDVAETGSEQLEAPVQQQQKSTRKPRAYGNNNSASAYQEVSHSNTNNGENVNDDPQITSAVKEVYPQINETLEALILDNSMQVLLKVPVSEIIKRLDSLEGARFLVMDGIITQRLIDAAYRAGIEYVVGHRMAELKKSPEITVRTFDQIGIGN